MLMAVLSLVFALAIVCAAASDEVTRSGVIQEPTLVQRDRWIEIAAAAAAAAENAAAAAEENAAAAAAAAAVADDLGTPVAEISDEAGPTLFFLIFWLALSVLLLRRMLRNKASEKPEVLCPHLGMVFAAVLAQVFDESHFEQVLELEQELPQVLETEMREVLSSVLGEGRSGDFAMAVRKAFVKYYTGCKKTESSAAQTHSLSEVEGNTHLVQATTRMLEVSSKCIINEDAASTNRAASEVQDIVLLKESVGYSVEVDGHDCSSLPLSTPNPVSTGATVPPEVMDVMKRSLQAQERLVEAQERLVELKWISLQQRGANMSKRMSLREEELKLAEKSTSLMEESNELKRMRFEQEMTKEENEAISAGSIRLCKLCADNLMGGMLVMITAMVYGTWKQCPRWFNDCHLEFQEKPKFSWHYMSWMLSVVEDLAKSSTCFFKGTVGILAGLVAFFLLVSFMFRKLLTTSTESRPGTVLIVCLLLGVVGVYTVNLLGGSGASWIVFWTLLCCCHTFSNYSSRPLFTFFRKSKQRRGYFGLLVEPVFHFIMMVALPATVGMAAFPDSWSSWGRDLATSW